MKGNRCDRATCTEYTMILRSGLGCEAKEWIGKVEKLHKTENSVLTLKATKRITC